MANTEYSSILTNVPTNTNAGKNVNELIEKQTFTFVIDCHLGNSKVCFVSNLCH
jgi:hypothetical protein